MAKLPFALCAVLAITLLTGPLLDAKVNTRAFYCGAGTGDKPEFQTVQRDCKITAHYGYHFDIRYLDDGEWVRRQPGDNTEWIPASPPEGECRNNVNFVKSIVNNIHITIHVRADANNGTNCGGWKKFTVPEVPGVPK
ncbi:hypothetical protein [Caballeronia sordidicola]|uniref:hypothetical protein n=1 Tax=Caballeronia sordidicola TaxID=196367 RepID=UPI00126A6E42|nr:hypothetical protein [Caballeronia sordidicola]